MRRRILLAATAVAGASLALVVGISSASGHGRQTATTSTQTATLSCNVELISVPPKNQSAATPAADTGVQYGPASCSTDPAATTPRNFGHAAVQNMFSLADSGDTVGKYTMYFLTGSLRGTFDLTPQEGQGGFTSESFTGTATVTSAAGRYVGIKTQKPGTMDCNTTDSVHYFCTETATITMPASTH